VLVVVSVERNVSAANLQYRWIDRLDAVLHTSHDNESLPSIAIDTSLSRTYIPPLPEPVFG
jgi:hypothetical protein